jgi:hypothetical protein
VAPSVSDAKRFGGGSSSGMQRSMPTLPAAGWPAGGPRRSPTAAGCTAAPRSVPDGPIAGPGPRLRADEPSGLGEAFGNFLMLALLAMAAVFASASSCAVPADKARSASSWRRARRWRQAESPPKRR